MSDSFFDTGRKMSRREFVKVTSAVAAGTMLVGWLPKRTEAVAKKYPHWGVVLMVRNAAATDGPKINVGVVRTLVGHFLHAGFRKVRWDGKDKKGGDAGSGVFFYRLKAGGSIETKAMVLLN